MVWWGRWDLNPGSPTPQAGILDQSSQSILGIPKEHNLVAIRRPPSQKYEAEIINTLIHATNSGKAHNTTRLISYSLRQLDRNADLMKPNEIATYIANAKVSANTKNKLALAYQWFTKTNGVQYEKPYFKVERKIPMIPTTENIKKIIAASTDKYATIFTILAETGLEAHELATMTHKDIDLDRGIINALGCKGHNSRSFKLKPSTAEMLRKYAATYTEEHLFPNTKAMSEMWRLFRKRVAKKLNEPQLATIPMRNLRHHFATMKYDQTKDILLVKQLLGHKKLETTMFYTQLITFNNEEEYTCKATTDSKEAQDLLEYGFQYQLTTPDGLMLFRKRK